MASVKSLKRCRKNGSTYIRWRLSWRADVLQPDGTVKRKPFQKKFSTKAAADKRRVEIEAGISNGTYVPDAASRTVLQAAQAFLDHFEGLIKKGRRERSTFEAYQRQINLHVRRTDLATCKLSQLSTPKVQAALQWLETAGGLSANMTARVRARLIQIIDFAQRNGWIVGNPVQGTKVADDLERDRDPHVAIPDKADMQVILRAAAKFDSTGCAEAMLRLLAFGGLRLSELRGSMRDQLLDLRTESRRIRVTRRADAWQKIGSPKSKRAWREIPIGPATGASLLNWLKAAPMSKQHLVFPTSTGSVMNAANFRQRILIPVLRSIGFTRLEPAKHRETGEIILLDGHRPGEEHGDAPASKVIERPRYTAHQFRHFYASLQIENGVKPKRLQQLMGHRSLQMTMDLYGHLWKDTTADNAMGAAAERLVDAASRDA